MALRQGARSLARSVLMGKGLPMRGGGGGPVKMTGAPDKPLPLWDELWWDDGQVFSQPVLDGTMNTQPYTLAQSAGQLAVALGVVGATIWAAKTSWGENNAIYVPPQYPPEVLEAVTSRGKVGWNRPPVAGMPSTPMAE